jgi:hypothetical protein
MNVKQNGTGGWDIDKRVPVANLMAMMVQTIVIVAGVSWFIADLSGRMDVAEKNISEGIVWKNGTNLRLRTVEQKDAQLEERLVAHVDTLRRIERMTEVVYRRGLRTEEEGEGN